MTKSPNWSVSQETKLNNNFSIISVWADSKKRLEVTFSKFELE